MSPKPRRRTRSARWAPDGGGPSCWSMSPDSASQRADVLKVLHELASGPHATLDDAWEGRVVEVLNKVDLLQGADVPVSAPGSVAVSALTGEGLEALLAALDARMAAGLETVVYTLPAAAGARLAWLYRQGEVISREDAEAEVRVTVRLTAANRARFEKEHA